MRRHTQSLILTAALALSLVPALHAQGYREDGRYTIFPDVQHLDRASAIAHEIDETATQIRREFERNNRRPDRYEARAIEELRDLDRAATRFHRSTESYRREPRRTARTFAALEDAFNDASRSLRRIQPRPYVDRGMGRIYQLMDELGGFYGRRSGYYGAWGHDRDHDRYDRDRDHDRNHDHDRDNGYRPPHH
ncbi:MAG TPA: hypothetical protein VFR03_19950 [Thermoanaerobaculia bacterium]|nr:hypothetical protein [Thermoanaerobaculia bacterium]